LQQIHRYFQTHFNISDHDWEIFSSRLTRKQFPKKKALLSIGETEKNLSFIEEGIIRFYIPKEENDLTFGFAFENSFFSAYDSFLTQSPSTYVVETITDTALWRVTYEDLQDIYSKSQIGNLIGRKASEELFLKKTKRELSLLNDTAEDRYLKLFSERPEVIRQIPLKYIASYIGITPQALSRIRRRIT